MSKADPVVQRLHRRRLELKLSQRALSDQVGVSHGHISQIETGLVDPKLSTLRKIATRLDVPL